MKLFQPLKSSEINIEHVGKYSWAAKILGNNFEVISDEFDTLK